MTASVLKKGRVLAGLPESVSREGFKRSQEVSVSPALFPRLQLNHSLTDRQKAQVFWGITVSIGRGEWSAIQMLVQLSSTEIPLCISDKPGLKWQVSN